MTAGRTGVQVFSLTAMTVGIALFAYTLITMDREETWREVRRLGPAFPVVLAPSVAWHLLRTAGWWAAFPRESRPPYWRAFRVRLASDGVSYFTVRGLASEPLRVVLLLGRVPATVTAAASILERLAVAVSSLVVVGVVAGLAYSSEALEAEWQPLFRFIALASLVGLALGVLLLRGHARYLGPMLDGVGRRTGWRWTGGRAAHFVTDVEGVFLTLARSDHRRLGVLLTISVVSYALMALEVFVVFRVVGQPVSFWAATIVETFSRSASVLAGAIPANLGALEASQIAAARALGLAGGSLALARRMRSLLWAALGLAFYPRETFRVVRGAA
jgi:uncharacterized membrane protein YbhN (UPF0104 family)